LGSSNHIFVLLTIIPSQFNVVTGLKTDHRNIRALNDKLHYTVCVKSKNILG